MEQFLIQQNEGRSHSDTHSVVGLGSAVMDFHHVQLSCLLSHHRALTQTAHNNIENLFERALSQVTLLGLGQVDSHTAYCRVSYHCQTP